MEEVENIKRIKLDHLAQLETIKVIYLKEVTTPCLKAISKQNLETPFFKSYISDFQPLLRESQVLPEHSSMLYKNQVYRRLSFHLPYKL